MLPLEDNTMAEYRREVQLDSELLLLEEQLQTIPEGFSVQQAVLFLDVLDLKPGETFLDPFAGTGVLAMVAALKGIKSINIENNTKHYGIFQRNAHILRSIRPDIEAPELIFQDSLEMDELPEVIVIDAIITSPPFTLSTTSHPPEELTSYFIHLSDIRSVIAKFKRNLKRGGQVLMEIGNDDLDGVEIRLKEPFIEMMFKEDFEIIGFSPRPDSLVGSYYARFKKPLRGFKTQRLMIQQRLAATGTDTSHVEEG